MNGINHSNSNEFKLKRIDIQFSKEQLAMVQPSKRYERLSKTFQIKRQSQMRRLQYLLPYIKIDIIYEHLIHKSTKKEVSQILDLNYPTVLGVINSYLESGRIFKLMPYHSKVFLLKLRQSSIQNQQLYRARRKQYLQRQAFQVGQIIDREIAIFRYTDNDLRSSLDPRIQEPI